MTEVLYWKGKSCCDSEVNCSGITDKRRRSCDADRVTGDASWPIPSRPAARRCGAAVSLHLSPVPYKHALQNVQPGVVTFPDTLSTLRHPAPFCRLAKFLKLL